MNNSNLQTHTQRIGKFKISRMMVDKDPTTVRMALFHCIIVRAEVLWQGDCIEYVAISDRFDEVNEGCILPYYDVVIYDGRADLQPDRIEFIRSPFAL